MSASGISSCIPKGSTGGCAGGTGALADTLLPTLLPFLILTGILLRTDGITRIVQPIAPFFKVLTGLSGEGAYAFVLGLLCGYPMGAKLTADLYHAGKISRQESEYLLTFCNNPSPAFLVTYVGHLSGRKSSGGISRRNSVSFRYDLHVLFPLLRLSKKKHACFGRPGIYRKQGSRTGRHPRFRDHEQF